MTVIEFNKPVLSEIWSLMLKLTGQKESANGLCKTYTHTHTLQKVDLAVRFALEFGDLTPFC